MTSTSTITATAVLGAAVAVALGPTWLALVLAFGLIVSWVFERMERRRRVPRDEIETHQIETPRSQSQITGLAGQAIFEPDGSLRSTSKTLHVLLGWSPGDLESMSLNELVRSRDRARASAAFDAVALVPKSTAAFDIEVRTSTDWRWMHVDIENACDVPGVGGVVMAVTDISRVHALEGQIASGNDRLSIVAGLGALAMEGTESSTMAHAIVTEVRTALDTRSCDLFVLDEGEAELVRVAGVGLGGIPNHSTPDATLFDLVETAVRGGPPALRLVDGTLTTDPARIGSAVAVAVATESSSIQRGSLVACAAEDQSFDVGAFEFLQAVANVCTLATRQRGAEQVAFHNAHYDKLTGLLNRDSFVEKLNRSRERANETGEDLAVLLIGLDHFKLINDGLGHATGDELLASVGSRLKDGLRPGDTLARFSGDEFVVLADRLHTPNQARSAAERLQVTLGEAFEIGGRDISLTASIGIAVGRQRTAATLLQQADAALVQAKADGRERVEFFKDTMVDAAMTRLRTQDELRAALEAGQLRVFYQPIVDLGSGATTAAEALLRWVHPTRGLVGPSEFIPISEATGLIEDIGSWVLDEALGQARRWATAGHPTRVSVNVAGRQLGDPAFARSIARALEKNDVAPSSLLIELGETALLAPSETALQTLEEIAALGVEVCVDDYGTAQSSLHQIRSLPIAEVKLDRALIDGIARSGEDYAIVSALIQVAQRLGKRVVAEGIETEQQLELLQDLGCDLGQGFLFSPAVFDLEHGSNTVAWQKVDHAHRSHDHSDN